MIIHDKIKILSVFYLVLEFSIKIGYLVLSFRIKMVIFM
jgi:hypothetical protein